jgi:hypothetical protein
MDKKQAYEILNQALSQIQTTRPNHALLIEALNTLSAIHAETPAPPTS